MPRPRGTWFYRHWQVCASFKKLVKQQPKSHRPPATACSKPNLSCFSQNPAVVSHPCNDTPAHPVRPKTCHQRLLPLLHSLLFAPCLPIFHSSVSPVPPPSSGCPLTSSSVYMLTSQQASLHPLLPHPTLLPALPPAIFKSLSTSLSCFRISTGFPSARRISSMSLGWVYRPCETWLISPSSGPPHFCLCFSYSSFPAGPWVCFQACALAVLCLVCLPSVPLPLCYLAHH